MIHLSDTDQAPYSAPAPQTAIVSDEAVQVMPERIYAVQTSGKSVIGFDTPSLDYKFEYVRADISALSASPCSVEVKKLEWRKPTDHPQDMEGECSSVANGIGGRYSISNPERNKDGVYGWLLYLADDEFRWEWFPSIAEAKAAAQADFDRRILSQIVTKPVDVATLTPAEAVYGLLGWLTSRNETVALGSSHGAAIGAELAAEFCKENNLGDYRDSFPENLKHPKTAASQPVDVAAVRKQAFEEAAQVAEIRHEKWSNGDGFHDSEGLPAVSCDVTACENIAAAIRALSPAEPVDQWQDIATAPKDGTDILVFDGLGVVVAAFDADPTLEDFLAIADAGEGEKEFQEWINDDNFGLGWVGHESISGDTVHLHPTHWMPLPAAPTSKGGE